MKHIYTSIDIGTDTVKFLVGEVQGENVYVLSARTIKSRGIRKGLIVDSNLAVNTIKDGIKEISSDLGIEIKKVIVNVPDYNVKFMYVTGKINVGGVIKTEHINKIIKGSVYGKIDRDYELVTVIPLEFNLDSKESTQYPCSLECKILYLKGIMITVPKKNIYSVISVIEGASLEVVDITLSGLGDYFQVKNESIDKKVGAIINLGHETTNVSIFNHGILMNTETIQLGGANVENDIAYVFGINVIDARKIKEKFASSIKRFNKLDEVYELENNFKEKIKLNQLEVTEVVMSRMVEILKLAKKQIILLTKKEIEYIVLTGGLTEIKSFKNLVYEILGKNVIIYLMDEIGIRDNKYTSAIGMIRYFDNKMKIRGKDYSMITLDSEKILVSPEGKKKKEKINVSKMLKGFMKNKEEK